MVGKTEGETQRGGGGGGGGTHPSSVLTLLPIFFPSHDFVRDLQLGRAAPSVQAEIAARAGESREVLPKTRNKPTRTPARRAPTRYRPSLPPGLEKGQQKRDGASKRAG